MDERTLTFREFLNDIRLVVTSPSRRLSLVHGRGAVWGSVLLLSFPLYFGFSFVGGVYFDSDPFPGYSFILPAVLAAASALLRVYLIHVFGRLIEAKGHYGRATGSYHGILAVFGYTHIPSILAMTLGLILFWLIPGPMVAFFRDFHTVAISLMIAIGAALFIWNLILIVLAMRLVYPIRDYKIVITYILGSAAFVIPAAAMGCLVISAQIPAAYIRPLLNSRILSFVDADPDSRDSSSWRSSINIEVDRVRYRFRSPERYELATYDGAINAGVGKGKAVVTHSVAVFSLHDQVFGRILGLPGETVELAGGVLQINGRTWDEPYILPEYRSDASFPPTRLSGSQYFVLPDNRKLVESHRDDLVVSLSRLSGRAILNKWPLGWWLYRSTAYEKPAQETLLHEDRQPITGVSPTAP